MLRSSLPIPGQKFSFASTALVLGLALAMPALAADKKSKTPSTLPPTSPMLAVPKADETDSAGQQPGQLISSEMSGRDLQFFTTVVSAGREQAYLADLLRTKASSEQIRTLAETLAGAQEEENKHLADLAARKGLKMSLEPTSAEKKEGAELDKQTGVNYDKAAMDKIGAASRQTMSAYQDAVQSMDPEIKRFASQMLPLAEEKRHLVEKMTGAGNKAAAQLFRHGADAETTTAPSTPTPKDSTPQPKTTPVGKSGPAGKPTPTPKATPTPLPKSATGPLATPPGQALPSGTPSPLLPPILPSRHAAASLPALIPPPTSGQ